MFGLTEVQARIYGHLLSHGESGAREVAEACGVSRGKIYALLHVLEGRGLIGYTPTVPRRYQPLDVSATFKAVEQELRAGAEEAANLREDLARAAPPPDPSVPPTIPVMIRGRHAVTAALRRFLESADRRIVLLTSDTAFERNRPWLLPVLRERTKELDSVRLLLAGGKAAAKLAKSVGDGVRVAGVREDAKGVTLCLADGERLLLCRWVPDDLSSRGKEDYGIEVSDAALVPAMEGLGRWVRDAGRR
jgi:sugar-specific transcriptional regulator TrmB